MAFPEDRYPYRPEDAFPQEEVYGRFAGDDGSYARRNAAPENTDGYVPSLSNFYRTPAYSDPAPFYREETDEDLRRVFGNSAPSRYDFENVPPRRDEPFSPFGYPEGPYTGYPAEDRGLYAPSAQETQSGYPRLPDPTELFAPMPEETGEFYSYDTPAETADVPETAPEPMRRKRSFRLSNPLLIACGAVLAILAVLLGVLLVDKVFTPKMMRSPAEKTEKPMISTDMPATAEQTAPDAEVLTAAAEEGTEEEAAAEQIPFFGSEGVESAVTIPAWSVFVVQAGAFSHPENADTCAMEWQNRGSAGYVLYSDEYYRVMTTVFSRENDAEEVRAALAGQNPSAQVYQLSFGEMTFTVTAREEDLTLITTAISQWPEWIRSLMAAERKMEAGDMDASAMSVSVKEIAAQVSDLRDQLEELPGVSDSPFLSRLLQMYEEAAHILADAAQQDSIAQDSIAMGRVKYAHIGMCWNYRKLVEEIAAQSAPAEEEAEAPAEGE